MTSHYRVPAGLLVKAVPAEGRLAEEQRILRERFPGFSLAAGGGDLFGTAKGSLTTFANISYAVRIELPRRYPFAVPEVYPDGWTPRDNPHMFGNNRICIMRSGQWVDYMSVAFAVTKVALWLNKYEVWREKRVWPGAEQHLHGPIYRIRKKYHGL